VLLLALSGLLAGCSTTQQTSARLKVRAERILAGRRPVQVGTENPGVRVVDAAVLRGHGRAAIAVTLHNSDPRPLNDLPILVGVRTGGHEVLVNRGHSFRYFEAHTPGLAAHRDTTWVLTAPGKKLPPGKPVVRVGSASHPPTVARDLPDLRVTGVGRDRGGKSTAVSATVDNEGGFPQYDLSVYAWAKRGGRFVAAGRQAIGDLGTGTEQPVRLALIGDPGKAEVHVSAPPTIFE
jgi:hypothetical protein